MKKSFVSSEKESLIERKEALIDKEELGLLREGESLIEAGNDSERKQNHIIRFPEELPLVFIWTNLALFK